MKEMTSCRRMDQLCMDTDCISAYRLGIDDVVIFVVDHRFRNIAKRRARLESFQPPGPPGLDQSLQHQGLHFEFSV